MNTRPGQDHYYGEIAFEGYCRSESVPAFGPTSWEKLQPFQRDAWLGAAIAVLDTYRESITKDGQTCRCGECPIVEYLPRLDVATVRTTPEAVAREETTKRLVFLETKLLDIGNAYNELTEAHNQLKRRVDGVSSLVDSTTDRFDLFQKTQHICNGRIADSLELLDKKIDPQAALGEVDEPVESDEETDDSDDVRSVMWDLFHDVTAWVNTPAADTTKEELFLRRAARQAKKLLTHIK